ARAENSDDVDVVPRLDESDARVVTSRLDGHGSVSREHERGHVLVLVCGREVRPQDELLLLDRVADLEAENLVLFGFTNGPLVDVGQWDFPNGDQVFRNRLAALDLLHGHEKLHLLAARGFDLEASLVENQEERAQNADEYGDEECATIHPGPML